jgi:hypothetical protein
MLLSVRGPSLPAFLLRQSDIFLRPLDLLYDFGGYIYLTCGNDVNFSFIFSLTTQCISVF